MTLDPQSEFAECQPPCAIATIAFDRKCPARPPLTFVESNPVVAANEITDHHSLHAVLRARADELGNLALDHRFRGRPARRLQLKALVVSPNQLRRIGMTSLGPLLSALCLKLIAVPDDEAFARNKSRLLKRDHAHYTSARKGPRLEARNGASPGAKNPPSQKYSASANGQVH